MNIAGMWDQLIDCICRPPRDEYSLDELVGGTKGTFTLSGRPYVRQDSSLTNKAGQKLVSSHYRSAEAVNTKVPQPCVIYCHCNSGSRRDAEEALYILLPHNISVFCLDFAGSGRSEGDWVTLGALEVDDLEAAVDHLRRTGSATTIGLWGRSMGAVTALLYSQRDPSIAGMVLDSPFSRLTDLMMELVEEQKLPIPKPFMKMALGMMRRSVRKRAHFNIDHVAPLDAVPQSFSPALFGHAEGDTFIHKHHSERLHKAYAGDKNLITFEGDHNSMRPQFFYNSVLIFMHNVLQCTAMLLPETVASAKRSSQADDLPPEPLRALATQTSLRSQRSVPWTQTPTWNGNRDEFAQLWDEEVARSQQAGDSEDSQSETASQGDVQDTGAPVQRSSQAEAHARALAVEEELMVARALEMSLMDSIQQACPGHPPSNLSQPVERGGQQRQASLDAVVPAAMQQMDPLDAEEMMLIQAIQASLREADKLEQAPSPAQAADTKPRDCG
ncbi:hypothetical protein WJX72_006872 [[Myrmecia] bisecta]|uniref:Serine aminopeptidase S33 domain-containing protein n=1 Tax=[Myrmecia] bisecta TaxID=41462 RepID=A0AAW1P5B1_9CHLO